MKSGISFFNSGIAKNYLKRFWALWAAYLGILIFALPVNALNAAPAAEGMRRAMLIENAVLYSGINMVYISAAFCAAAARLNRSLCLGREPLLVIPASHDSQALLDVPANKVFMKAGRAILELQRTLLDRGQLDGASMVENCGMPNERVYPRFADLKEPSGYFSLVIAKQRNAGR